MVTKIFFRVFTTRFYSILCFPFRSIKGFEYILCNASLIVIFIFYIDVQLIWPHLLKKYSCIYGVALALLLKILWLYMCGSPYPVYKYWLLCFICPRRRHVLKQLIHVFSTYVSSSNSTSLFSSPFLLTDLDLISCHIYTSPCPTFY